MIPLNTWRSIINMENTSQSSDASVCDGEPQDVDEAKVEALKLGKFTDCVFLVGPESGEQQEVHAVKAMMMMLSPFMDKMFNGPFCPPSPIRIENVDVKTFQLVNEYVHCSKLVTEDVTCEEAADLAVAADFFLIDSLKRECKEIIREDISADVVWPVLNKLLKANLSEIADETCSLLNYHTKECLEHPSFLTASEQSLKFLLDQDTMDLKSELQLVAYCLQWAVKQPEKILVMRKLMPWFRLLTIDAKDIASMPAFLEDKELLAILKLSLTEGKDVELPETICKLTQSRNFHAAKSLVENVKKASPFDELYFQIIPSRLYSFVPTSAMTFTATHNITNTLVFYSLKDCNLTGIGCLSRIFDFPPLVFNKKTSAFEEDHSQVFDKSMKITVTVSLNDTDKNYDCNIPDISSSTARQLVFHNQPALFIPCDQKCTIAVTLLATPEKP